MPKERVYDSVWRRVRAAVLVRDDYRCQVRLAGCTGDATDVDHIIPVSEGGARLDAHNLRASCGYCNTARSSGRLAKLGAELAAALSGPVGDHGPSRQW